jgi:hypothetical protein
MNERSKGMIAVLMGIVIAVLDLYWIYISYSGYYSAPTILGVIILAADLVWLWIDWDLMKR